MPCISPQCAQVSRKRNNGTPEIAARADASGHFLTACAKKPGVSPLPKILLKIEPAPPISRGRPKLPGNHPVSIRERRRLRPRHDGRLRRQRTLTPSLPPHRSSFAPPALSPARRFPHEAPSGSRHFMLSQNAIRLKLSGHSPNSARSLGP